MKTAAAMAAAAVDTATIRPTTTPCSATQTHGGNIVKNLMLTDLQFFSSLEREREISNKIHVSFPITLLPQCLWEFKNSNLSQIWKKMQIKMSHEPIKFQQLLEIGK